MFALCKEFDKLSLEGITGGSSSSSSVPASSSSTSLVQSYRDTMHTFFNNLHSNLLDHISWPIVEKLQAPFIELPRLVLDSAFQSYNIRMLLCFRFLPGQDEMLLHELRLPQSFERFSFIKKHLGLSYNSGVLPMSSLLAYSSAGAGLRTVITDNVLQRLVEVITYYEGRYWRFLVLVCAGIGCTVWYGYEYGASNVAPTGELFRRFETYDPFFNMEMEYYLPGFRRVCFVEINDVSASVESAFSEEVPFAEIKIPASGPLLKAVGLGVMVAFFLTVGIVPNIYGDINVEI